MLRVLCALAVLATAPIETASADVPHHSDMTTSDQIFSDGPRAVAARLTLKHRWFRVEYDIANNDPSLSSTTLLALLTYTPRHETAAVQRALRARLKKDPLAGLAALSPIARSPFSGKAVCGSGDARWKHQMRPSLIATHDIVYALQRDACLKALRVRSRS